MAETTYSEEAFVKIRNLTFCRGERIIFDNINVDIIKGKVTAVMGPSGTGKTTLLRLIGGQLKPHIGTITIDGIDINKLSAKKLFQLRQRIGLLFQSGALFTHLNVFDNVAFPLREHTALPERLIQDIVLMKLQAVGLRGARLLMPSQLSGGMARRVALARTIALDPELIMYDEPFTGQDPISMGVIVKLTSQLNKALGLTSIIVSHDVAETIAIADSIYILSNGKIVGQGTAEHLKTSDNPYVKQFIHGLPDGVVPFHYPANAYSTDILSEQLT